MKTRTFRQLHHADSGVLILPNAWDVVSARLVESLGAKAVATTSAGVAWSLGYADGNHLPLPRLGELVDRIVKSVNVPVTIDVEGGYSDDPRMVVEGLKPVFDTGIAGINIEDGSDSPELLARKVEAIKEFAAKASIDIFINVRTDVVLRNLAPDAEKVDETLKRAVLYSRAGADGLFVPGLKGADRISAVCKGTALPVNVMSVPGLPPAKELAALGVRRLSAGSALSQMVWQRFAELAESFLASGDSLLLSKDAMEYGRLQSLFAKTR